ncbi:MAG: hypothetical protein PHR35_13555 [Kiritimatiellae bacterium]|nr:hypothetical protein [Kiritimatiellia bacterium]
MHELPKKLSPVISPMAKGSIYSVVALATLFLVVVGCVSTPPPTVVVPYIPGTEPEVEATKAALTLEEAVTNVARLVNQSLSGPVFGNEANDGYWATREVIRCDDSGYRWVERGDMNSRQLPPSQLASGFALYAFLMEHNKEEQGKPFSHTNDVPFSSITKAEMAMQTGTGAQEFIRFYCDDTFAFDVEILGAPALRNLALASMELICKNLAAPATNRFEARQP